MNDEAVYRTAPATPGLLIMGYEKVKLSRDSFETDTSLILENLWNYRNFSDITLATKVQTRIKSAQGCSQLS